jgi:5-hydroxyisourate hydrolase-like protein (transthyretin family)
LAIAAARVIRIAAPQAAGNVLGRIEDAVTGRPLTGVQVRLFRGALEQGTQETDAAGRFTFKEVPEGIYSVEVEAAAHLKAVQTGVRVVLNKAASLDFALVPTSDSPLEEVVISARNAQRAL